MIRIYYNNRPVIISGDPNKWDHTEDGLFISADASILNEAINIIQRGDVPRLFFYSTDPEKTFSELKSTCKVLVAAGGLVVNKKGDILVIFRNGKWDIPKGKLEKGEDPVTGAKREIQEECGVEVKINGPLLNTYHFYDHQGERILKETHWFLAEAGEDVQLRPQQEEGITEVRWVNQEGIPEIYADTYDNIRDLLDRYRSLSSGV